MKKRWLLGVSLLFLFIYSTGVSGPLISTKAGAEGERDSGEREYTVESSVNDDLFVINGHAFKAKTFCTNILEGDKVIFLKGRADGYCDTATFVNVRTGEKCEVLCEGR